MTSTFNLQPSSLSASGSDLVLVRPVRAALLVGLCLATYARGTGALVWTSHDLLVR